MLTAPPFWDQRNLLSRLLSYSLWPLALIYGWFFSLRNAAQDLHFAKAAPVPLIIVGNIRVGGTGKTPIVIALALQLKSLGWHPGIISRGYINASSKKKSAHHHATKLREAIEVTPRSDPAVVGDEPVLIAQKTHGTIPIWVQANRRKSIAALLNKNPQVNVIISDDGLQNFGLPRWPAREGGRDIELVVRDSRGEGNGFLLPAGPLREPANRERDATLMTSVEINSATDPNYFLEQRAVYLSPEIGLAYSLNDHSLQYSLAEIAQMFAPTMIVAVAALGNPSRFFTCLKEHGLKPRTIALPDHSSFSSEFFTEIKAECILITEKDAVKCRHIADERIWVVPMKVTLSTDFMNWVTSIISRPDPRQK
jgi:tetraacyldisaccharide 4'-kinase